MIGIIQQVLLELLEQHGGNELKQRVLTTANVDPSINYRIDKNYSDDECLRLIAASVEETGFTESEVYALYASAFLKKARSLFPRFFEIADDSEGFLLRQARIHAVMASGLKQQDERQHVNDKFSASPIEPGVVRVIYRSPNGLCRLYQALAFEVASLYGDEIEFNEPCCMHKGAVHCEFIITWPHKRQEVAHD